MWVISRQKVLPVLGSILEGGLVVGNSDVLGMQCCFINWFLTVMLRNHLRNNTASPKHQNYRPLGRVILWLLFGNLNRITN